MYYKKSKDIEDRFTTALALIFFFKPNVENLAMRLNVSRPTVVRIVNELRRRGNEIVVVRDTDGWHYQVKRLAIQQPQSSGETLSYSRSIPI